MQAPVLVMSAYFQIFLYLAFQNVTADSLILIDTQSGDRQTGRKAQLSNITAAKT